MIVKNIKTDIRNMGWCTNGEASKIYLQYQKSPFYNDNFMIFKLMTCLIFEGNYSDAVSLACGCLDKSKKADYRRFISF
jgi:hypothetical protein